ncbi:hypothetical protein [Dysgonomonas termitidis]|uniref:Uncharacterized protein n=1 Tax=Dysgonomonas termitidis TaxID=1516126 RepID=A0ABV9L2U2_9BACT
MKTKSTQLKPKSPVPTGQRLYYQNKGNRISPVIRQARRLLLSGKYISIRTDSLCLSGYIDKVIFILKCRDAAYGYRLYLSAMNDGYIKKGGTG